MYHIKGYIKSQELNLYGTVTKTDGLMEQQVVRRKLVNLRVKHRLKKGHLRMGKNEKKKGGGKNGTGRTGLPGKVNNYFRILSHTMFQNY